MCALCLPCSNTGRKTNDTAAFDNPVMWILVKHGLAKGGTGNQT